MAQILYRISKKIYEVINLKFEITIEEYLSRKISIEASSIEEAEDLAWKKYYKGEVILTSDDFRDVDIYAHQPIDYTNEKLFDLED